MSASKYVSEVKTIAHSQQSVYEYLSDFKNLSTFFNEYTLAQISQQTQKIQINSVNCDSDSVVFNVSQMGDAGLQIIERESPKMIKITGTGKIPFEIYLWIQILPVTPYQCKFRLTLHAHLNVMMKMMAGKKLQEGVDKIAEALTRFPYH
ncbi:MAG TPA: hypothetical protein PKH79_07500 [Prolixibacteraceae bacterium]|nr:hypothetical protein [Prolixibacteraceae bacterium]HPS13422.1 hypothetical protein [Prolixibacteraceae bacterium]